jgi:hypothetical protein
VNNLGALVSNTHWTGIKILSSVAQALSFSLAPPSFHVSVALWTLSSNL